MKLKKKILIFDIVTPEDYADICEAGNKGSKADKKLRRKLNV